jgi:triphosphoribosyl-dephospho-CoA synthase
LFNPFICSGLFIEPLVHPKPGGVTRVYSHDDKSVYNFIANNLAFCTTIPTYISGILDEDCILGKVYEYIVHVLRRYGLRTNTSMGSWVLHIPLIISSLSIKEDDFTIQELVRQGVKITENTDSCDTRGYFEFLRFYSPSHLGRLAKGGIDVTSMYNALPSYVDVVKFAGQSDIVHRELYTGYTISLEAYSTIKNLMNDETVFEDAVSKTVTVLLSKYPDSLIARKYGSRAALKVRRLAELVVEGMVSQEELDRYMRSNRFNPGSILDIVSTGISLFLTEKSMEGRIDNIISV